MTTLHETTMENHADTDQGGGMSSSYVRYFAMIGTSIVVMFFLMYLAFPTSLLTMPGLAKRGCLWP